MSQELQGRSSLEFPFKGVPTPTQCWSVCDGIRWIRLPLPFALDHVNCWILGEPGNEVLVDTGVATPNTRQQWLHHWGGRGGDSLARTPEKLLITHFHPDHTGLASWFHDAGSELYGSAVEMAFSRQVWAIDDTEYGESSARWYALHGLPDAQITTVRENANTYRRLVQQPPAKQAWTCLEAGQVIELGGHEYEVLVGCGHAPDMLMLFRPADHVLVAADQVLPSISPNVSVMPGTEDKNPLGSFLQSLNALKNLPADTLVLPSHGAPFKGLHARIEFLEAHHEERLAAVRRACHEPLTAYDLFGVLFRRTLDAQQTSFALGESLAHLHYLEARGELQRQGVDGVDRFVLA